MTWKTVNCIQSMFKGRQQNGNEVPWLIDPTILPIYKYWMPAPDTMQIDFSVQNTIVNSNPLQLLMQLPDDFNIADYSNSTLVWWENGYDDAGVGRLAADLRDINFLRMTKVPSYQPKKSANNTWVKSNGTYVMGQLTLRVK